MPNFLFSFNYVKSALLVFSLFQGHLALSVTTDGPDAATEHSKVIPAHIWSGKTYYENKGIQFLGAIDQLKHFSFKGTENVLDIGSGDGEITHLISELTQGTVEGLDLDFSMVQHASTKYRKSNLIFIQGSASDLSKSGVYDLITSFNAIHWIKDQKDLLKRVHTALQPKGKILFGMPTIIQDENVGTSLMVKVLRELSSSPKWSPFLKDFRPPWYFFGKKEYENILTESHFVPIRVEVTIKPFKLKNKQAFVNWMRQILPHLKLIPGARQDEFLREVAQEYLRKVPLNKNGEVQLSHAQLEVIAEK